MTVQADALNPLETPIVQAWLWEVPDATPSAAGVYRAWWEHSPHLGDFARLRLPIGDTLLSPGEARRLAAALTYVADLIEKDVK